MEDSGFIQLIITLSIASLILLMVSGYNAKNTNSLFMGILFLSFILGGVVLYLINRKFKAMEFGTFSQSSFFLLLFMGGWLILGSRAGSVVLFPPNTLFATISGELSAMTQFTLSSIGIPIAEEIFFMIGIPFAIIGIAKSFDKEINVYLLMFIMFLVTGFGFAIFHTAKFTLGFIIFALFFRAVGIITVVGDQLKDWFKFAEIPVSAMIGAHIGNNWAVYGFKSGIILIFNNLFQTANILSFSLSLIIVIFFITMVIGAINYVGQIFYNGAGQTQ